MAIEVRMYISNLDNRVVSKYAKLGSGVDYTNLTFRDEADLHNPEFTIEANLSADYNYCRIKGVDGVTRYYYAKVINIRTNLSFVSCKLDVLSNITPSNIVIVPDRSEEIRNDYIIDSARPVEARVQHYNVPFSGGSGLDYNNMTCVAGIVGTGGNPTNNFPT